MEDGGTSRRLCALVVLAALAPCGCASMRFNAPLRDLRPCTEDFADTADGWHLGIRRYRPAQPDPGKHPVVLCHGLGLNGTFWTLTDHHLPEQLAARGYEVFVVDLRGSGASHRGGRLGRINARLRETPFNEIDEARWTMDDQAFSDVPAILDYVQAHTGDNQVNWVGHSLGGMLLFPYLERTPSPNRIASFVAMGSPAILSTAPDWDMVKSNRRLRMLMHFVSTGRMGRPLMYFQPPGLDRIDSYYYSKDSVDRQTVSRFYGYTLENPGRGALKQLETYSRTGHLWSSNGKVDYAAKLGDVKVPMLYVASEGDVLAPLGGVVQSYKATGSPDKTLMLFGRRHGHRAEYGHCDLVWSRNAPDEIFPAVCDWLDQRQPTLPAEQRPSSQEAVQTNLRPALELRPSPQQIR